jgi:hypothetical protein
VATDELPAAPDQRISESGIDRTRPQRRSTDDPVALARYRLVSDMLALRDSLDAIRDRLGRLASGDQGVIEVREATDTD